MAWPRDDAKLARVRALMAERGLDALVVRAPDNVLYLTNFWGMKGYDACVFPREGEPVLICLEASEEDAARTAWTRDVRLSTATTRATRGRRWRARSSSPGGGRRLRAVGLELSLGTQAADRMVGEPTTFTRAWFDAFPDAEDATPLLAEARALKTEQEIERMRLANEIAAAAMEHCRLVIEPGHDRGADRRGVGGLRPRRGHGLGGEGRARARLLARLVGGRDQDVHGHDLAAGGRGRADAVRDLGLRRRLLVRPHEEPRLRRADAALPRARAGAHGRVRGRDRLLAAGASLAELDRRVRAGIDALGFPGQPSHPIAHGVGARAHEPPYAHQAGGGELAEGMVLAIEPGCYIEGGGGLRVEDNFLITADGAEKLSPFPDGIVST